MRPRGMKMKRPREDWGLRIGLFIISMLLGMMVTVQFTANNRPRTSFSGDLIQLRSQLIYEIENQQHLRQEIDRAQEKIVEYQRSSGDQQKLAQSMQEELEKLKEEAGFTPVSGAGIQITLRDNPQYFMQLPSSVQPDDLAISDEELMSMVNTLFANGARAVAINGNRLVTTSSIRSLTPSMLQVNARSVVPPYVISAVGDDVERMKDVVQSMYAENLRLFHAKDMVITTYSKANALQVPAYTEIRDLQYAQVDTEGKQP